MIAKGQITVTNIDDGKTPFLYQAYKMKDGRFLKHYPVYEASPISGYKEGDLWHRTDGSQPGYFVANKSNTTLKLSDWTFYANELTHNDTDKFYPKFEGTYSDYNKVASDDQTKYTWKIIKADDGIGIKSVTEYYLATSESSGIKYTDKRFTTKMQPMTATNKYLWNYEKINFSNNKSQPTIPVIIGVYGDKGQPGGTGATGRSITAIQEYYMATSASKDVKRPNTDGTNGWTTTMQMTTPTDKYLWNYEKITWSSGTTTTYVEPIIIGVHGEKGDKGDNAPLVKLSGATQIITESSTGTGTPTRTPKESFTVVGTSVNTSISSWTYSVNGGTFGTKLPRGVSRDENTVKIIPTSITFNTLSIKATGGGVSDTFTIARIVDGEKGAKGDPGSPGGTGSAGKDAYTVLLSNESHTFQAGTTNAIEGSTTTDIYAYKGTNRVAVKVGAITGMPEGMTGTVIDNGKVNARITFTVATKMTRPSGTVIINLTVDNKPIVKEFSYALTFKGQNAVVGLLTNESITLPANKDGLVPSTSFTGAKGVFDVYDGITKKTFSGLVKYSVVSQSNITVGINATTGAYSVTAMPRATPTGTIILNGYATLKAIYNGVTIEKQLNVAKSLTGATGAPGARGPQGATGSRGPVGATGTSVSSVTEYYLATSEPSGIKDTDKRFTTAMQPITATNKYLWNYEKINFSNNTSQPTIPVIIGVYGDKGQPGGTGATGRSITSITEHYLATSAKTGVSRSTSGWGTSMKPTTPTNKYLWNYETINWSSGTTPTYVEPIIIGVHGDKGASATSYWITASNNIIGKSQTGVINPTTITFKGFSKTGTATPVAYSGRFIIQTSTNGTTYTTRYTSSTNQNTYTYTIPANSLFVKCLFYMAGGTTVLLDEQTVPIVESAEGIEIGNRNWLVNTVNPSGVNPIYTLGSEPSISGKLTIRNGWTKVEHNTGSSEIYYRFNVPRDNHLGGLIAGKTYTISMTVKGKGSVNYRAQYKTTGNWITVPELMPSTPLSETEEKTIVFTVKVPIDSTAFYLSIDCKENIAGNYIEFYRPMLVEGNISMPHQPAPEDARTYKAWANSSDGTVDFTRVYPNENLLLGSNEAITTAGYKVKEYILSDTTLTASDDVVITINGYLNTDRQAFGAYLDGGVGGFGTLTKVRDGVYQASRKWTPRDNQTKIELYQLPSNGTSESTVHSIKLERGTVETIYTTNSGDSLSGSMPKYVGFSPLDSDKSSDYEWILNPEYTKAISDESLSDKADKGDIEDINKNLGGKVDNDTFKGVQEIAEEFAKSYEAFISDDGKHKKDLEALEKRIEQMILELGDKVIKLDFIKTYMTAGSEGLLIGSKDSSIKMLLSSGSLIFIDGKEKLAEFSGQSFTVEKGSILQDVQIGEHKASKFGNGQTVFQWVK